MVAGGGAFNLQRDYPTTAAANAYVSTQLSSDLARLDANDLLYQIDASRNYDPFNALESISTPITWVNSADDFLNLPGSPLIDAAAKRLKHGRFYLIPISPETRGHGTHTLARLWKRQLEELLA